jgi:hypothetical protein
MGIKKTRILLAFIGFFVSIEFVITIIALVSIFIFRETFRSIGWAILVEKEAAKTIGAIPLGVLAYVVKTGHDIAAPKGDPLPDHISDWPDSDSILDFVTIGIIWAAINLTITWIVLLFPKIIHSGSLFILVVWSVLLSAYQGINFFREEIRFIKFLNLKQ